MPPKPTEAAFENDRIRYEYGESRVIVGFHYQSDVDAARIITSALINRLHANNDFVRQLQKAKKEFLSKL